MRQTVSLIVVVALLLGLVIAPVLAADKAPPSPVAQSAPNASAARMGQGGDDVVEEDHTPPGELIIVDSVILRPLGIVACGVGVVGAIVTFPFAAMTNSNDRVGKALLQKPFDYTFKRPVGELDY